MSRTNAFILSLAIGLIAIVGVFAAVRTVGLGTSARSAQNAQIASKTAALDRYAASLQKALAKSAVPARAGNAIQATPAAQPVRVVYHRPPPIVVHVHRSGSHEEAEGSGLDD